VPSAYALRRRTTAVTLSEAPLATAVDTSASVTADTDRYGLPRLPVENTGADGFASLITRATGRS